MNNVGRLQIEDCQQANIPGKRRDGRGSIQVTDKVGEIIPDGIGKRPDQRGRF